ncbi:TPA: hypothetical protein U1C34_001849 [Streptococcus suis]|nr:hypothetical protein [Streptococcus suis]HEM3623041.1 hypothetical protein [Streptococcus suis]
MIKYVKEYWMFVGIALLVVLFVGISLLHPHQKDTKRKSSETEQVTQEKDHSSEEMPTETENEKNYRQAFLALERPYGSVSSVDKETVSTSLFQGLQTLASAKSVSDVKGTVENHLSMTGQPMLETVGIAFLINHYQVDQTSLVVTPSKSEDVLQFLVVLKNENSANAYLIGNWNKTVDQLQLVQLIGGDIGATYG